MSTEYRTLAVVTCDGCDQVAGEDLAISIFHTLEQAVETLTALGADWEYFPDTDRWVCDRCRAIEACHAAGGHTWGSWKDSFLRDGTRWRECVRTFDFARCPGYETRSIETARVKEGVL